MTFEAEKYKTWKIVQPQPLYTVQDQDGNLYGTFHSHEGAVEKRKQLVFKQWYEHSTENRIMRNGQGLPWEVAYAWLQSNHHAIRDFV